jgi:outer membrane protein OmpA-like peptidoglycan-associated protein
MSDSNNDSKKGGFLTSFGFLTAGVAIAAVAYFWAKPIHQGEQSAADSASHAIATTTGDAPKTAMDVNVAKLNTDVAVKATTTPETTAPLAASAVTTATKTDAQVFFAMGKNTVSPEALMALEVVVAKMKANPAAKAVLSGYTDATGNVAQNELLAKERAQAVREVLRKAGVAGDKDVRIEMKKPETLTGSVDADKARRVEVTVK